MVESLCLSSEFPECLNTISTEFSNHTFNETPLTALSTATVKKLSTCLNNFEIIPSEEGYERDWRGLATLSGQRSLCSVVHKNPFKRVLEQWCECNPTMATFGNLVQYLGVIDRWAVLEDVTENLLEDYQNYVDIKEQSTSTAARENNQNTSIANKKNIFPNINLGLESNILTTNDVECHQKGQPLQTYDAFILYADADYNIALDIFQNLQNNSLYNFKFCLKRDLVSDEPFKHAALMELIRERCTFLIVILTKEFTKSPENNLFVKYAQALQIKEDMRKVIPLLYEDDVKIPANLTMFLCLRYNPSCRDLYWSTLAKSLRLFQLKQKVAELSATSHSYFANSRRLEEIQNLPADSSANGKKKARNNESSLKALNTVENDSNRSRGRFKTLFSRKN